MYRNDEYMTIHDALVNIKKKWPSVNPPNPFPDDFTIFEYITIGEDRHDTYGLTVNNLWSIFNQWFALLAVAKRVPRIGYEYVWRGSVNTVTDVPDQALYVWRCLDDMVGWYCKANYNRWYHLILADTQQYDPITNYNMEEQSGSSSIVSGTTTKPVGATTQNQVYPYNMNTATSEGTPVDGKPESKSILTYNGIAESGYKEANKKFDNNDGYLDTPEGNATNVSRLVRKGNIGVTTSQQMIQSEYDLRKYNVLQDFMNEVAKYSLITDWDSALNDTY